MSCHKRLLSSSIAQPVVFSLCCLQLLIIKHKGVSMKNSLRSLIATAFFIVVPIAAMHEQIMVVKEPVISLRTAPQESGKEQDLAASKKMFGRHYDDVMKMLEAPYRDPLQATQLLYNERVAVVKEEADGWVTVKALEQCRFNESTKQWESLQGFVKKEQLLEVEKNKPHNLVIYTKSATANGANIPMGSTLQGTLDLHNQYHVTLADGKKAIIPALHVWEINKNKTEPLCAIRKHIISAATELLGDRYDWGGRTHFATLRGMACSTDCSGFINLAYRAAGIAIPRNAHDMFLLSKPVTTGKKLQPADCIFLAPADHPERVTHVLLFVGKNMLMENNIAKGATQIHAHEKFGTSLNTLRNGDTVKYTDSLGNRTLQHIYFGSFLADATLMNQLVEYAMGNHEIIQRWR